MAEGLPEGLVTNSEAISGDIHGVDHIAPEDLAHLWRGNSELSSSRSDTLSSLPDCSLHYKPEAPCQRCWSKAGELFLENMEQQEDPGQHSRKPGSTHIHRYF